MVFLNSRNTFAVLTVILLLEKQIQSLPLGSTSSLKTRDLIDPKQQSQQTQNDSHSNSQTQTIHFNSGLPSDSFGIKRKRENENKLQTNHKEEDEKKKEGNDQFEETEPSKFGRLTSNHQTSAFSEQELSSLHLRKRLSIGNKNEEFEIKRDLIFEKRSKKQPQPTTTNSTITIPPNNSNPSQTNSPDDIDNELSDDGTSLVADNLYPLIKRQKEDDEIQSLQKKSMPLPHSKKGPHSILPRDSVDDEFANKAFEIRLKKRNPVKLNKREESKAESETSESEAEERKGNKTQSSISYKPLNKEPKSKINPNSKGSKTRRKLSLSDEKLRKRAASDVESGHTTNQHWSDGDSEAGQGTYWKGATNHQNNVGNSFSSVPTKPQPQPQPQQYQTNKQNSYWKGGSKQKRDNPYWHSSQNGYWKDEHQMRGGGGGSEGVMQMNALGGGDEGGDTGMASKVITEEMPPQESQPGGVGNEINQRSSLNDEFDSIINPFKFIKKDQEIRSKYSSSLIKKRWNPPSKNLYWKQDENHEGWSTEKSDGLANYWKNTNKKSKKKKRSVGKVIDDYDSADEDGKQYITAKSDEGLTDLDKKKFEATVKNTDEKKEKSAKPTTTGDDHDSCLENEKKGIIPQGLCEAQRMNTLLAGSIRKREEDGEQKKNITINLEKLPVLNNNQTNLTNPNEISSSSLTPTSQAQVPLNQTTSTSSPTNVSNPIIRLQDLQSKRTELTLQQKEIENEIHELYKQFPILSATIQLK